MKDGKKFNSWYLYRKYDEVRGIKDYSYRVVRNNMKYGIIKFQSSKFKYNKYFTEALKPKYKYIFNVDIPRMTKFTFGGLVIPGGIGISHNISWHATGSGGAGGMGGIV